MIATPRVNHPPFNIKFWSSPVFRVVLLLLLLFVFVQHYLFLQIEFNNLVEREARVLRLVFASRKLERLIFLFMNLYLRVSIGFNDWRVDSRKN